MIKNWIQNLIAFLLLMSLVNQLIPGANFQKYIRLTTGLILIYVMLSPMIQWMNIDEKALVNLIQSELNTAAEEAKSSKLVFDTSKVFVKQYKSMIGEEIISYFESFSVKVAYWEVQLNEDSSSSDYGTVKAISIGIIPADMDIDINTANSNIKVDKVDIDSQKHPSEEVHIPEEKIKEWRQDLLLWFELEENQLELEIIS